MSLVTQSNPVFDGALGSATPAAEESCAGRIAPQPAVIVNADDWGRDELTTNRTLDCFVHGSLSSVSAMVFMRDSERAADLARQHGIDAGLHLNFTLLFTGWPRPGGLAEHQEKVSRTLLSHRFSPIIYYPHLAGAFEYLVKLQVAEYERLYGTAPKRIDGHHHMHLCTNVLMQKLIPSGIIVRRNFTFDTGEKSLLNRLYRRWQDKRLGRHHRMADYFFDLQPLNPPSRLSRIFTQAATSNVEIEAHPIREEEYSFLMSELFPGDAGAVTVSRGYTLRTFGQYASVGSLA
jgi:hypothetical protein